MSDRWLDDLEELARAALPEPVHRYFRQGARDGVSAAEAVEAWSSYRLAPRILRDVTRVELATTVLGTPVASPVAVAPTTLQRAAHPDGEVATARGVAEAGGLLVVSSNAGSTFAAISDTGVPWWLQVYLPGDRTSVKPLLERAVAAGARAIVLTADTPVVGTKYLGPGLDVWDLVDPTWLRVNFEEGDDGGSPHGSEKATDLGPHDLGWLAATTDLPVVVKGVLRPDDARRCVDAGAAAVWVSNHGGRQLDRVASTASCLAAVVDEVGDDAEVYVDGGVRSGLDVLTALALGARVAFLGRPVLYGLAAGGADGVARVLADLSAELKETLILAGCPGPGEVDRSLVRPR